MCFQFPCDIDQAIEYDLLLMASTGVMRKKTCKLSLIFLSSNISAFLKFLVFSGYCVSCKGKEMRPVLR